MCGVLQLSSVKPGFTARLLCEGSSRTKGGMTVQVPENVTGLRRRRGRAPQPDGLSQIVDRINGLVSRNRQLETENQRLQRMLEEIRGTLNVTDGRVPATAPKRRRKSPSPEVLEKRREALAKARAVRLSRIRAQKQEG